MHEFCHVFGACKQRHESTPKLIVLVAIVALNFVHVTLAWALHAHTSKAWLEARVTESLIQQAEIYLLAAVTVAALWRLTTVAFGLCAKLKSKGTADTSGSQED